VPFMTGYNADEATLYVRRCLSGPRRETSKPLWPRGGFRGRR